MYKLSLENESAKKYIYSLSERLMRYFDISYEIIKEGEHFEMYAYHRQEFRKSFLTRSTVYEGYAVFEHLMVRVIPECSINVVSQFANLLVEITPKLASADKHHKRSLITGILVIENAISTEKEISSFVKKFFYRKNYRWCFHGWSETQMIVTSLEDKKTYLPKNCKELKKLVLSF